MDITNMHIDDILKKVKRIHFIGIGGAGMCPLAEILIQLGYNVSGSDNNDTETFRRIEKEGKMKAIVSITLDNEFVIHDIKVIEGEKGLFIAMPSRKASDGEYRDIAHPINSATREQIQTIILDKYQEVMAEEAENEVLMEAAE